ncbi:tetratricopeptide repeat protein, partial [bacterium]
MKEAYKKASLAFVLIFLIVVAGCSGADEKTRKNEALSSQQFAEAYMRDGKPARALQELAKAQALTPEDPKITHMMGVAYWQKKEYALAEQSFLKAVALKDDYSEVWNTLGALYISQNRFSDAVRVLEKALSNVYYNSYESAMSNLGWALYKLGRNAEAKVKLAEAIEIDPNQPVTRVNMAILLYDEENYEEAFKHANEALRVAPDYANAHLQKGMIQIKMGDKEGARESLTQAWK